MTISANDKAAFRTGYNAGIDAVARYLRLAADKIETHDFSNAKPGDLAASRAKLTKLAELTRAYADDAELLKIGGGSPSPVAPDDPPSPVAPAAAAVAA